MNWKEDVKALFSEQKDARKWDEMYEKDTENLDQANFRLRRDYVVEYILSKYDSDSCICDVGCGSGPVIYEILRKDHNIIGLDYSIDMLQNAKRRLHEGGITATPLVNGNGESLPFQGEKFDCVVCLGVISYVENYENIIKEIHRILKPGGTLLISFRNKYNLIMNDPVVLLRFLFEKILVSGQSAAHEEFEIGDYMARREVMDLVRSNGFKYENFKGIGFGPYSFRHRKLFGMNTSITVSNIITTLANGLNLTLIFNLASDVNILIFRKPACSIGGT